jgi:hypothetical protein
MEIRGVDAAAALARSFRSRGRAGIEEGGFCQYGQFVDLDGATIDDGLLIPIPGEPSSWLLSLHGNPVLLQSLGEVFRELGGVEGSAELPILAGDGGRIEREAHECLPLALTEEGVACLLFQADRGFMTWARRVSTGDLSPSVEELEGLLARARGARGLLEARRVVLTGVPNAGKSTLFNRLLGERRVVTHESPGTTRDLIEERGVIGAYPVWLVDAAGVREAPDGIEREGVSRAWEAIASADLVVLLEPPPEVAPGPGFPSAGLDARMTLKIQSRADQISKWGGAGAGLRISAVTGEGLEELEAEILRRLFGAEGPPLDRTAPFLRRHEKILREALESLEAGGPVREILARL